MHTPRIRRDNFLTSWVQSLQVRPGGSPLGNGGRLGNNSPRTYVNAVRGDDIYHILKSEW